MTRQQCFSSSVSLKFILCSDSLKYYIAACQQCFSSSVSLKFILCSDSLKYCIAAFLYLAQSYAVNTVHFWFSSISSSTNGKCNVGSQYIHYTLSLLARIVNRVTFPLCVQDELRGHSVLRDLTHSCYSLTSIIVDYNAVPDNDKGTFVKNRSQER